MRLGGAKLVRVCPFTYFQVHIWENTVLPKDCACILLALQTDSLCQGRSASSQSWETPLFPHFMCKRAVRSVPRIPFQLTLAVPRSTLVQTLRFLWRSSSFLSPKRTCVQKTSGMEWGGRLLLYTNICFNRRGYNSLFHHGAFFHWLWFNLRWEMSQEGNERIYMGSRIYII